MWIFLFFLGFSSQADPLKTDINAEVLDLTIQIYQTCMDRHFLTTKPSPTVEQSKRFCLETNQKQLARMEGLKVAIDDKNSSVGTTAYYEIRAELSSNKLKKEFLTGPRTGAVALSCNSHQLPEQETTQAAQEIVDELKSGKFACYIVKKDSEEEDLDVENREYGYGFEKVGNKCKPICPTGKIFSPEIAGLEADKLVNLTDACVDCASPIVQEKNNYFHLTDSLAKSFFTTNGYRNECVDKDGCPNGKLKFGYLDGRPNCKFLCKAPEINDSKGECVKDPDYCEKTKSKLESEIHYNDLSRISGLTLGICLPPKVQKLIGQYESMVRNGISSYVERCKAATYLDKDVEKIVSSKPLPSFSKFIRDSCQTKDVRIDADLADQLESSGLRYDSLEAYSAAETLFPNTQETIMDKFFGLLKVPVEALGNGRLGYPSTPYMLPPTRGSR